MDNTTGPADLSVLGPGVWVELSVAADIEAVEAVSEILTRYAPGGTSVEPGFRLTDEGLGAAIDAAVGAGIHPDFPAAIQAMTHPGDTFHPDPRAHARYDELYFRVYKQMYKRLQPLYRAMQAK